MAIRVLGISGSLRRESFNTKLLHNVAELMPEGMILEIADISGLAIYNEDDTVNPRVLDFLWDG